MPLHKLLTHWCKDLDWSLKRLLVYVGMIVLSVIMLIHAWRYGITDWKILPAYGCTLVTLYSPQLFITALKIWKGIPEDKKETANAIN